GGRVDGLADRSYRLREILLLMHMRNVARLEVHLGDALVVAPNEAEQDLGEESSLLSPEPAHNAEIDRDDTPRFVDEKIPLMHVGMEEAVAKRIAQKGLDEGFREPARIVSELGETLRVRERNAVDPFHGHDFARRAVPIDRRRANVWIV